MAWLSSTTGGTVDSVAVGCGTCVRVPAADISIPDELPSAFQRVLRAHEAEHEHENIALTISEPV